MKFLITTLLVLSLIGCAPGGGSGKGGKGGGGGGGTTPSSGAGTAVVTFYAGPSVMGKIGPITISIDNSMIGTITNYYPNGNPDCGSIDPRSVSVTINAGIHTWSAIAQLVNSNDTYIWPSKAGNVEAGKCYLIMLSVQ